MDTKNIDPNDIVMVCTDERFGDAVASLHVALAKYSADVQHVMLASTLNYVVEVLDLGSDCVAELAKQFRDDRNDTFRLGGWQTMDKPPKA